MSMIANPAPVQLDIAQVIADYNADIDRLKAEMESRKHALARQLFAGIEQPDPARAAHCMRTSRYAVDIAIEMGLDAQIIEDIRLAGIFHDYGALNAPPEILAKQDTLTPQEQIILCQYVLEGARVLATIRDYHNVVNIIETHYEWFAGEGGYPGRRKGLLIPIGARILAVANAYDALLTRRPDHPQPPSEQEALIELLAKAGLQFDPDVLEAFRHVI